jgi:hypothetical protein
MTLNMIIILTNFNKSLDISLRVHKVFKSKLILLMFSVGDFYEYVRE